MLWTMEIKDSINVRAEILGVAWLPRLFTHHGKRQDYKATDLQTRLQDTLNAHQSRSLNETLPSMCQGAVYTDFECQLTHHSPKYTTATSRVMYSFI
jgi:hypothetical protein